MDQSSILIRTWILLHHFLKSFKMTFGSVIVLISVKRRARLIKQVFSKNLLWCVIGCLVWMEKILIFLSFMIFGQFLAKLCTVAYERHLQELHLIFGSIRGAEWRKVPHCSTDYCFEKVLKNSWRLKASLLVVLLDVLLLYTGNRLNSLKIWVKCLQMDWNSNLASEVNGLARAWEDAYYPERVTRRVTIIFCQLHFYLVGSGLLLMHVWALTCLC